MNLSTTAQATLLLTCYFSKANKEQVKPLTTAEWGRFAAWLKDKSITPADLLTENPNTLLASWGDRYISLERLRALLARGHSLALAMEKWQRAGLWVLTRSDVDYPKRLKARLRTDSPPVLFGCGNRSLLEVGGIAVVGSRNAGEADLAFTTALGAKAATQGVAIVSGGARGVDEHAMLGTLRAGGQVIGVIADNLLSAATSAKWRKGIMDGNLVLFSPFYPEAGFSTGNAMARNKYIYCLADTAVVVHSGQTGGTITGAQENLKKQWIPLWVKPNQDNDTGNSLLVTKGGRWCEPDIQALDLAALLRESIANSTAVESQASDDYSPNLAQQPDLFTATTQEIPSEEQTVVAHSFPSQLDISPSNNVTDFYQVFVNETARIASTPLSLDELMKTTALNKSQLNDWLKRMIDEGLAKKVGRPTRYQFNRLKLG